MVLFAGFKQKDDALAEFKKALEMAPDVKLDKLLATPEIQEVFDQAVSEQKSAGGGGETTTPSADAITHEPVTVSAQGKAIPINLTLDSSIKPKKVVLSFSADGSEDFGEREMKEESPGNWMGEIPASATEGAKVSYYIEVDGDDDQVLAKKGSATEPLVVKLRGTAVAKKQGAAAAGEETRDRRADLVLRVRARHRLRLDDRAGGDQPGRRQHHGMIGPNMQIDDPPGRQGEPGRVRLGAARADRARGGLLPDPRADGVAAAPAAVRQRRDAVLRGAGDTRPAGRACSARRRRWSVAGFARAHYFLHLEDSDFQPFVAGMLGGGTIRHVATFNTHPSAASNMQTTCVDTIPAGPVFVGAGGGVLYNISPVFALTGELDAVAGFTKFTFNIDVNVGVAVLYYLRQPAFAISVANRWAWA